MQTVRSIFIWLGVILATLFVFFPILICSTLLLPFNPQKTWAHRVGNVWGFFIFRISPRWKVSLRGRENLPKGPAILVSNHESMADIIAVYLLNSDFKWLAKSELFRVPFFGWSMALCGYIPLERGSIKSTAASLEKARGYLKKGVPILIFPEGTRSETGELREFKGGAFKLAIEEKVPVIPIVMTGTRHILQKGDWKLAEQIFVQIQILPAVSTSQVTAEGERDLRHLVREQMKESLLELKKERHAELGTSD